MSKVIPIHEAKTNLSKLIKEVQSGETIYIGAYGQPQVMLSPVVYRNEVHIGAWNHRKKIDYELLEESNAEIAQWLESDR